jgi:nitronate monooxygenase
LPFWLAGAQARPEALRAALAAGATGVQIGTPFAFCRESGLRPDIKRAVLQRARAGEVELRTDPRASPTGMPFKVVSLPGTVSDPAIYAPRTRQCDLGYLRQNYRRPDGTVGYRCPAEDEANFVQKGGSLPDTVDRKCLCNGLMAAIGHAQPRGDGMVEPPIVTAGEDVKELARFLHTATDDYTADEVLNYVQG